ncbi:hypothetical protein [Methylibium sp.]|uniref:hypothetical protein n=1 Tax=Methylibium sp. TaxID=2067992 RepID=UPI0025E34FB1|nr:hypothetical protein [Methylibium sp.]
MMMEPHQVEAQPRQAPGLLPYRLRLGAEQRRCRQVGAPEAGRAAIAEHQRITLRTNEATPSSRLFVFVQKRQVNVGVTPIDDMLRPCIGSAGP